MLEEWQEIRCNCQQPQILLPEWEHQERIPASPTAPTLTPTRTSLLMDAGQAGDRFTRLYFFPG
jgi:hypothetical protein